MGESVEGDTDCRVNRLPFTHSHDFVLGHHQGVAELEFAGDPAPQGHLGGDLHRRRRDLAVTHLGVDVLDGEQPAFDKHREVYRRTWPDLTVAELTAEGPRGVTGAWTVGRCQSNLADIGGERQRDLIAVADLIALDRHDLLAKLYMVLERAEAGNGDDIAEPLSRADVQDIHREDLAGVGAFDKDRTGHDGELLHRPALAVVPVAK